MKQVKANVKLHKIRMTALSVFKFIDVQTLDLVNFSYVIFLFARLSNNNKVKNILIYKISSLAL